MTGGAGVARAIVPPEPPGTPAGRRGVDWIGEAWADATKRQRIEAVVIVLAALTLVMFLIW